MGLGPNVALFFKDLLLKYDQISQLVLPKNKLGNMGAKAIAELLTVNQSLVKLDLS